MFALGIIALIFLALWAGANLFGLATTDTEVSLVWYFFWIVGFGLPIYYIAVTL